MENNHKTKTEMVTEFHKKFGFSINVPLEDNYIIEQRLTFIDEEVRELREAILTGNKPDILKELCDILYMTIGLGVCYGLPVDKGFQRVHDSNMSKSPNPSPMVKPLRVLNISKQN